MRVTLALLLAMSTIGTLSAQFYYKNSTGVRLGYTSGLTYKHFINRAEAMEFMASGRKEGFQVTGLYLFHRPIDTGFNNDFYFFYGVGGHVGVERFPDQRLVGSSSTPSLNEFDTDERTFFTMGVNTTVGVEYRWFRVPVTIGLDIKPFLNFIGMRQTKFRFWDTALSVKYIF